MVDAIDIFISANRGDRAYTQPLPCNVNCAIVNRKWNRNDVSAMRSNRLEAWVLSTMFIHWVAFRRRLHKIHVVDNRIDVLYPAVILVRVQLCIRFVWLFVRNVCNVRVCVHKQYTYREREQTKCNANAVLAVITYPSTTFVIVLTRCFYWMAEWWHVIMQPHSYRFLCISHVLCWQWAPIISHLDIFACIGVAICEMWKCKPQRQHTNRFMW